MKLKMCKSIAGKKSSQLLLIIIGQGKEKAQEWDWFEIARHRLQQHISQFLWGIKWEICARGEGGEMHDFYILFCFFLNLNLGRIPEKSYILN